MEKKTIFLELPCETIDEIDRQNIVGDRSLYISNLLNKQLQQEISTMNISTTNTIENKTNTPLNPNEIKIVDHTDTSIGTFDINTVEGFEKLAKKISELSKDPVVRMRAKFWK